jgi:Rrf2 family transcriptional regulator, iron-sulfur cluster assembly transcription factor
MTSIFSKSFAYALRGILYVALVSNDKSRIQVEEIARQLAVPKYFLGKVMKKIVKNGLLNSTRGPYGGISLNDKTLSTTLFHLITITNGMNQFGNCVLRLKECNSHQPCPLHHQMEAYKKELHQILTKTTIGDLLHAESSLVP